LNKLPHTVKHLEESSGKVLKDLAPGRDWAVTIDCPLAGPQKGAPHKAPLPFQRQPVALCSKIRQLLLCVPGQISYGRIRDCDSPPLCVLHIFEPCLYQHLVPTGQRSRLDRRNEMPEGIEVYPHCLSSKG